MPYNIQMLVGDQTHCKPGADHTQKQHVKYGLQDWYRVRWLTTSDGRAVFPVVGDAAFFTENHPHHGLCPKVLQALLNGSKTVSRNDKRHADFRGQQYTPSPPAHTIGYASQPPPTTPCVAQRNTACSTRPTLRWTELPSRYPPPPPSKQVPPPPLVWDPPPLLAPHTHGMRSHRAAFFAQFHFHQYATIPASIHPSAAMQVSPALTTN